MRRADGLTVMLLLIGLAPTGSGVAAAVNRAPHQQKVDLDRLISDIERKYSRMRALAANFVQIYRGADGRLLRESGRLLLKRPGKARWDYIEPERKIFISDGKYVYFYVFGERRATRASIKESGDLQLPFSFLLGPIQIRRYFSRIELLSERPDGDLLLRLVPRRAPEGFREMIAQINPTSLEIRRLTIVERNGARMDFLLSDLRENFVAPDSEFKFSPPPGVETVSR